MHHSVGVSARLPFAQPEEGGLAPWLLREAAPECGVEPVPECGVEPVPECGVEPVPERVSERVAVIVLGMHRSGTSAMARLLSLLGCALPATLMPGRGGNEGGHWESEAICAFNDALLAEAGRHWADWRAMGPVPDEDRLARGAQVLRGEFGAAPLFVMKDPRQCRLLPFWLAVLRREQVAARAVITLRHPWEVAQSLARRDGLGAGQAHMLWLAHMLEAEAASRGMPRVVCRYDWLVAQDAGGLGAMAQNLGEGLGVAWPELSPQVAQEMARFIAPEGRHHVAGAGEQGALQGWAGRVFAILSRWAERGEDGADHAELDAMAAGFAQAGPDLARLMAQGEGGHDAAAQAEAAALATAAAQKALMRARIDLEGARGSLAGALEWLAEERDAREAGEAVLAQREALLAEREAGLLELAGLRDALIAERVMLIAQGEQEKARLTEAEGWVLKLARERHGLQRQASVQARCIAALEREAMRERQRHGGREAAHRAELAQMREQAHEREQAHRDAVVGLEQSLAQSLAQRWAQTVAEARAEQAAAEAREAGLTAQRAQDAGQQQRIEQDLAERYREITTLTTMLREGEDAVRRREDEAAWMRDVWTALERAPAWWGWVPAPLRRRWREERLARRGLFDARAYRGTHRDVADKGIDPLTHYIAHGMAEGRAMTEQGA